MSKTTRLLLLRHGEVEAPYQRVFGGRIDMGLSPVGHEQARRLAEHLRTVPFDAVYVSPLQRAQQTVAPLAATNGHQPVTLDSLREVDFGAWTGRSWEQVRSEFGMSPFHWLRELDRNAIPGAEPIAAFRARGAAVLERTLRDHEGATVALVCHGGVVRLLLALLLDLPLPKMTAFEVDYASVTVVDHREGKSEVQLLNYTPWRPWP